MDVIFLASGNSDSALLKEIVDSGEFFKVYVQVGRGNLGIAGVSALVRLGSWT